MNTEAPTRPGEVVLVAIYAKTKFDNMPAAVLKMWKDAYDA